MGLTFDQMRRALNHGKGPSPYLCPKCGDPFSHKDMNINSIGNIDAYCTRENAGPHSCCGGLTTFTSTSQILMYLLFEKLDDMFSELENKD